MPDTLVGQIAALGTSVSWTFTSVFFTIASRRVGSVVVNRVRLVLAVIFLSTTHLVVQGRWFPLNVGSERWFWLGLSGVLGLVMGDAFLYQAFVWIGARRAMLLMSLGPIISTVSAWVFLGETLSLVEMSAIGMTIGGIAWVVSERGGANGADTDPRHYWLGVLSGIGGAMGQALGLVASKRGMVGDFSPLSATLVRMVVAMLLMWTYAILRGRAGTTLRALADRRASLAMVGGAFAGPFLGVWLSLIAVKLARVGIASTLMALPPVFLLLPSRWVFKDQISVQAAVGTFVAIGGVSILFLL